MQSTLLVKQLPVFADFHDAAAFHHSNQVIVFDRIQTVDERYQRSLSLPSSLEQVLDASLGIVVKTRCCFVHDQNRQLFEKGSGDWLQTICLFLPNCSSIREFENSCPPCDGIPQFRGSNTGSRVSFVRVMTLIVDLRAYLY
jgi:hypothetical protein